MPTDVESQLRQLGERFRSEMTHVHADEILDRPQPTAPVEGGPLIALVERTSPTHRRTKWPTAVAAASDPRQRRGRWLVAAASVLIVAGVLGLVAVTRPTSTPPVALNDSVSINDPAGALFVLPDPIDSYQLASGHSSRSRQDPNAPVETFAPNGVLLGVVDGNGYTDLRSVSVYGTSPVDAEWEQVDTATGPAFVVSRPGIRVAQRRSDQWLLVTTLTDEQAALDMLDVVTIDDAGGIVVDANAAGLVVIDDYPIPTGGDGYGTYFEATTPDGALVVVETATASTPLFPAASVASRIEPTEIDGARAWTASRTDDNGMWNGLVWSATPNRIVALSGETTPAEIRRLAESLQVVEQTAWQQALPGATLE